MISRTDSNLPGAIEIPAHTLIIKSLRDAEAVCSCGNWSYLAPTFDSDKDVYIRGRITEAFQSHCKAA